MSLPSTTSSVCSFGTVMVIRDESRVAAVAAVCAKAVGEANVMNALSRRKTGLITEAPSLLSDTHDESAAGAHRDVDHFFCLHRARAALHRPIRGAVLYQHHLPLASAEEC